MSTIFFEIRIGITGRFRLVRTIRLRRKDVLKGLLSNSEVFLQPLAENAFVTLAAGVVGKFLSKMNTAPALYHCVKKKD
jgi:hypothetical protein